MTALGQGINAMAMSEAASAPDRTNPAGGSFRGPEGLTPPSTLPQPAGAAPTTPMPGMAPPTPPLAPGQIPHLESFPFLILDS